MKQLAILLMLLVGFTASTIAATIDIGAEDVGYGIPDGFVIQGHGIDFNDSYVYIWVQAEGDCRWESRQECSSDSNGQVHCRTYQERVCSQANTTYRLPASVVVDKDAKRAYFTKEDGTRLAFGKIKTFLWNQWISLFDGAEALVNYQGAKLRLDTDLLGDSLHRLQFLELYGANPEAD
jgi:hypothetical protein